MAGYGTVSSGLPRRGEFGAELNEAASALCFLGPISRGNCPHGASHDDVSEIDVKCGKDFTKETRRYGRTEGALMLVDVFELVSKGVMKDGMKTSAREDETGPLENIVLNPVTTSDSRTTAKTKEPKRSKTLQRHRSHQRTTSSVCVHR